MLRRTKTTLIDGQPLLNLPLRDVRLFSSHFQKEEKEFYLAMENKMKINIKKYKNVIKLLLKGEWKF